MGLINKIKDQAKKLHSRIHRIADGKVPHDVGSYLDYIFGWYNVKLQDIEEKVDETLQNTVDIFNQQLDFVALKKELKETNKQLKYLWQNLEDKKNES